MPYKIKKCESCDRNAHFKNKYDLRAMRCSQHKFDSDITCGRRRCEEETCHKVATFGEYGKRKRCSFHRYDTDKNLHSSCIVTDCNKFASFGPMKKKKRCVFHKLSGDRSIHYWCSNRLCEKPGTFFNKNKTGRCSIHKLKNDVERVKIDDDFADIFDLPVLDLPVLDSPGFDLPLFNSEEDALRFSEYMNPDNINF